MHVTMQPSTTSPVCASLMTYARRTMTNLLRRTLLGISLILALCLSISGTHAAVQFTAIDLGMFHGLPTWAVAVNINDQVVGFSGTDFSDPQYAFSWTPANGMIDLDTLGGTRPPSAINDKGQVVGWSSTSDDGNHAYSWTAKDSMIDLGTPEGFVSAATAVNARGQVVGYSSPIGASCCARASPWTAAGGMIDLGALGSGGESVAEAVNNKGQVVGSSSSIYGDSFHAFSWTTEGGMIDLGTLGGDYSRAVAVSDNGRVVGDSTAADNSRHHAFSWTAATG